MVAGLTAAVARYGYLDGYTHRLMIDPTLRALIVPIDTLRAQPRNARRHGQRNIDALAASLATFGQRKPLVGRRCADGRIEIVAGNGTLAAAKQLGWTEIAVSVQQLTDEEARAYAIADNRTAELAEWDLSQLADDIKQIESDLRGALGYLDTELTSILHAAELIPATRLPDGAPPRRTHLPDPASPVDSALADLPPALTTQEEEHSHVTVRFRSAEAREQFSRVVAKLTDKTTCVWYPPSK